MTDHVYMATTADVYELLCCVGSAKEIATFIGISVDSLYTLICKKKFDSNHNGYHVYKVKINKA